MTTRSVPFDPSLTLGCTVDTRQWKSVAGGKVQKVEKEFDKGNCLRFQYQKVNNFTNVCDVLGLPPGYALKVACGKVANKMVAACLKYVEDDEVLPIIFRASFVRLEMSVSTNYEVYVPEDDNLVMTDWVEALEVGDEMVVLVTFQCKDVAKLEEFHKIADKKLKDYDGHLDEDILGYLTETADKLNKKLSMGIYKDVVRLGLNYCTYQNVSYPAKLTEMVHAFRDFLLCCGADEYGSGKRSNVQAKAMSCCEVTGGTDVSMNRFRNQGTSLYMLRAHLTSLNNGRGQALSKEQHAYRLNVLYKQMVFVEKAELKLEDFLAKECEFIDDLLSKGKELKRKVKDSKDRIRSVTDSLDLASDLPDKIFDEILNIEAMDDVETFMQKLYILPKGGEVHLMMFGKTGHGKSSTGNSILGKREQFEMAASNVSKTLISAIGYSEVDKRIIKVVDTPGITDTRAKDGESGADVVSNAIIKGIALCDSGFHALVLVLNVKVTMTKEEVMAIEIMKRIMGKDIIKTHAICVLTHGRSYDGPSSFLKYCKQATGSLGSLFKECNYRCVLFENKTEDPKTLNSQRVKLVHMADVIGREGLYTSEVFKDAQKERQRAILELNAHEAEEDFVKGMSLVIDQLERMKQMHNLNEDNGYHLVSLESRLRALKEWMESKKIAAALSKEIDEFLKKTRVSKETIEALRVKLKEHYDTETTQNVEDVTIKQSEGLSSYVISCFPGTSTVFLEGGSTKMMKDLSIGDEVMVRGTDNMLKFDQVYMFGHRDKNTEQAFLVFETKINSVSVSSEHLVYCLKDGLEVCVPASSVTCGDQLYIADCDQFVPQTICEIKHERKQGLFAPFTTSGTIVVDGFLMSCYVDVFRPQMSHWLLGPFRQLYRISPAALAWINGNKEPSGIPTWIAMALKWL